MLELLLFSLLGFLGSFGHCAGMCGPLAVAFALSDRSDHPAAWQYHLYFHGWLNLGRLLSYTLVGAGMGALGSVLIAGGQLAGIGSPLRQSLTIFTGLLLTWLGLVQINPNLLPRLPLLHPLLQGKLHQQLQRTMTGLAAQPHPWQPLVLGITWGLIPCGFLYAAQLKAAETGNLWRGAATMLAFGLGTVPAMWGIGLSMSRFSADKRSQLFRMGGWVTLTIGILTLLRSNQMVDYTGHAALFCLMLALVARPLQQIVPVLLRYRRALGVGAYLLALAHAAHMLEHSFQWRLEGVAFMLPLHQLGIWTGFLALGLLTPAALTSCDRLVHILGKSWRWLHLLTIPALLLAVLHTLLIGSRYLGALEWTTTHWLLSILLVGVTLAVLLLRQRWVWSLIRLGNFYGPAQQD